MATFQTSNCNCLKGAEPETGGFPLCIPGLLVGCAHTISEIFKGHFHLRGKHTIHLNLIREPRSEIDEQEMKRAPAGGKHSPGAPQKVTCEMLSSVSTLI